MFLQFIFWFDSAADSGRSQGVLAALVVGVGLRQFSVASWLFVSALCYLPFSAGPGLCRFLHVAHQLAWAETAGKPSLASLACNVACVQSCWVVSM